MNWMISMCVSLCLGSGLLLLEFYLSKKKAWQAGLIPILIVDSVPAGWNPTWNSNIEAIRSLQMLIR